MRGDLERRPGRVVAGEGPVEAEGRGVRGGEDVAGPDVDRDEGGGHLAGAFDADSAALDGGGERGLDVLAVDRALLEQRAVGLGARGDLHPGGAAEHGVVRPWRPLTPAWSPAT